MKLVSRDMNGHATLLLDGSTAIYLRGFPL
jgi:hypothetical protein